MASNGGRPAGERLPPDHRQALPDPRRATAQELARAMELVRDSPVVTALLESVDAVLLVLNRQRQVVAINVPGGNERLGGLRPGEVLGCAFARAPGGCGTSSACETCGALGAILGCERNERPLSADCVIPEEPGGAAREFAVRATPVHLDGERFTVVSMRDVSAERRREALEQVFFHDVLNTVAGLRGWTARLARPGADVRRAGERLDVLGRRLEREIRDHRALVLAEAGALVPERARVEARALVDEVADLCCEHPEARERNLDVCVTPPALAIHTDAALLARVLVNMVRNAVEATEPGGTVRLVGEPDGAVSGGVRFAVHNAGAIPAALQPRIFQRSFSTKGRGRGLGTYGMKLIGERYLRGRVTFASTPADGTTFEILLPAELPSREATPLRSRPA